MSALELRSLVRLVLIVGAICLRIANTEQALCDELLFDEPIPFFTTYCLDCHTGGEDAEGGFDFEAFTTREEVLDRRARWQHLAALIESGAMPPEDSDPLPTEEERQAILAWLDQFLTPDCGASGSAGRVTIRRLSNYEYDNTIQDLFGIRFKPSIEVGFPTDDVASGFNNQGDALSVSPLLLEKYLDSAERTAQKVIENKGSRSRLVKQGDSKQAKLQATFEWLMPRVFRRPVQPIELQHVLDLANRVLEQDGDLDKALSVGIQSILVSPNFLFRVEEPGGATSEQVEATEEPIESYALATRLSYYLWSSMPDGQLTEAAASGDLQDRAKLTEQIERMIADDKSFALVESFMHQWLALDLLYQVEPDQEEFPLWSSWLREAMIQETERLFERVLREDRPLSELLLAKESFLNPRLAELYGVEYEGKDPYDLYLNANNGTERKWRVKNPQRVHRFDDEERFVLTTLPGVRHGLLTHASILTLTSNATNTSPVKRGKWVLEALLGDPPPPAPPTVPSLEETAGDMQGLPLREQLAIHRSNPNCASCHVKMDSIGLAMQNYDPIGQWRDQEAGQPIDTTGELDGTKFDGLADLADLLASREEEIARNLVRRLMTYALGRGLSIDDECAVTEILDQTREQGFRVQSLVIEVALSKPFRLREVSPQEANDE